MTVAADARTIHQRMVAILTELPPIGKTQKNEQQNFMFRGHDDVLNALNPLLAKHGVFVVPDVLDRVASERTTSKGSTMFEVNLHVRFTFWGNEGDSVSASTWGEGTDMGDKATNKAMTMAFKNVLNQAFAISNAEATDADRDTPDESKSRKPRVPAVSKAEKMRRRIEELAREADAKRTREEVTEPDEEGEEHTVSVPVEPGTTWDEIAQVVAWAATEPSDDDSKERPEGWGGNAWDTLAEPDLLWLGETLAEYVAAAGDGAHDTFYEWVTVPF